MGDKMNSKKLDKNITKKKLMIAICVLCFILLIVGISFGYYLANINGSGKAISGKIAKLDITFVDGDDVNPSVFSPIYDSSRVNNAYKKTFTVENNSNTGANIDAEYDVYLVLSKLDSALRSPYIKWELLKDDVVISSGDFSTANTNSDGIKLTTSKEQIELDSGIQNLEFRLWLSYSDSVDQTAMLNKSLSGKLKVIANDAEI